MLQSMGSQRVGRDLATERQQSMETEPMEESYVKLQYQIITAFTQSR